VFRHNESDETDAIEPSRRASLIAPSTQFMIILQVLDVDPDHVVRDLAIIQKQSQEFDLASKPLLATLLANPRFQGWLSNRDADMIDIEGRLDPSNFGRTSPVSYICANLVQLFSEERDSIVLHFFCGQHAASNDRLHGPKGLVRSFLAQLIHSSKNVQVENDIGGLITANNGLLNMVTLCQSFNLLVMQMSRHTKVYCIIDDICQYETERLQEDYMYLLDLFAHLLAESGPRTKLLLTSPTRSRQIRRWTQQPPLELTERVQSRRKFVL
jgi:hypothetical protein